MKVEPCQERSSSIVNEVERVKKYNKLVVTTKDKALKKKKKLVSHVKFDESLNLTHVHSC